jgi:hypothetical protein
LLEDEPRAIHVWQIIFGSKQQGVASVLVSSIFPQASGLHPKKPSLEAVQRTRKSGQERTIEEAPVPLRQTVATEGAFRADGMDEKRLTSDILSRLQVLLDLVPVIPQVPSDFPQLDNQRRGPILASIPTTEPKEVSLLNARPFNGDASFKECQPGDAILSRDGLKEAWHIRLSRRERLGGAPFSETLNDPMHNVLCRVHFLHPVAKRRHQQSPNEEDGRFLALPDVPQILGKRAAGAVGCGLLLPANEHGTDGAESRCVFRDPAAASERKTGQSGSTSVPVDATSVASQCRIVLPWM